MTGLILGGKVPRLKFDSAVAITFDGNSHVSIIREANIFPTTPSDMGNIPINNIGIGGQTWRMMNGLDGGSSADVDAGYVLGRTNVLIALEVTNTLREFGRTAAQGWQDTKDYCNARQAAVQATYPGASPWIILLGTGLPLGNNYPYGDAVPRNAAIYEYNALMRADYRSVAKGVFDTRAAGSIFVDGSVGIANITNGDYAQGDSIHSTPAGYALGVVGPITAALRLLPAR